MNESDTLPMEDQKDLSTDIDICTDLEFFFFMSFTAGGSVVSAAIACFDGGVWRRGRPL